MKSTKVVKINKSKFKAYIGLMLVVMLFCVYSLVLVGQRNMINNLDNEIRGLQKQYNNAVKVNDDLQGQLLRARNIQDIEYYATQVLGMVKPTSDNVVYVSYVNDPIDATVSAMSNEIVSEDSLTTAVADIIN